MDFKGLFQLRWLLILALLSLPSCSIPARDPTPTSAVLSPPTALAAPTRALEPSPTPPPTSTPAACTETTGRIDRQQINTSHLPKPLQVSIYLPPCFNLYPAVPYPVLLLLHGQSFTNDQWERLGITGAADRLIASGSIAPLLIVMPREEDTLSNPFESGYDLAIMQDLLPWLSKTYPACGERPCRAIGGLSRGAAWAMYIGLTHWQDFGAIGAHSDAPFYGDYNRLPYLVREIPKDQLPKIWMDSGSRDRYLSQSRHYHELLLQYKVPHEYSLLTGEHDETYWSQHVEDYLRWYAGAIAPANR